MLVRKPTQNHKSNERGVTRREARLEERKLKRLTAIKPVKSNKGFA